MNIKFTWLLAGLVAFVCAGATAFAQNVALPSSFSALVRTPAGLSALDADGALLRSTDNGVSFSSRRAADSPAALFALGASGSTVVAMGDSGYFVRSTDSGATFPASLAPAITPTFVGKIQSLAANGAEWIGVGIRGSGYAIIRSTDGGASWANATTIPSGSGQLHGVTWTGTRWVAVGANALGGVILTSSTGASWSLLTTTDYTLYSVASNGAGKVLVGGDVGTLLYASDGAATAGSFTSVGNDLVSEAIRTVAYLSGSSWISGGDSAVLVSFNDATSTPALVAGPDLNSGGAPITALISTGVGASYYFATPITATTPPGPISLSVSSSGGQLALTLVGATTGNDYYLERSTDLSVWSAVSGSQRSYSGGTAPAWTYSLPGAGERVFYRAKSGIPSL